MSFIVTTIILISPIQIKGQPVANHSISEPYMDPPYIQENECAVPNSNVGSSSSEKSPSCEKQSVSNITDVKCFGAIDDPPNCKMDISCIGGNNEPLNCREVPFSHSGGN